MKELLKKNFAIVLAFVLPILFIAVVALSTYLPSLFISTDYNFIYATCAANTGYYPYNCNNYLQKRYSIVDGKLVVKDVPQEQLFDYPEKPRVVNVEYDSRIFFHDTDKNETKEITLKEAQALTLSGLLTSPDGVTVSSSYESSSGFFLFDGGSSSYGYYLTKGKSKSALNLVNKNERYHYADNFRFIGWVLPGRS